MEENNIETTNVPSTNMGGGAGEITKAVKVSHIQGASGNLLWVEQGDTGDYILARQFE
jgi:hypothetical protein